MGRPSLAIGVGRLGKVGFQNVGKVIAVESLPYPGLAIKGAVLDDLSGVIYWGAVVFPIRNIEAKVAIQFLPKLSGDKRPLRAIR
jgi:hypothetical protein